MLVQFFSLFPSATCSFIHKARRQGSFLHFIVLIVRGEVIRLPEKEVPVLAHQANVYKCIRSKNLVWQSIWRFFFFFVLCIFLVLFSKSPCLVCCRHQQQSYQLSPSPRWALLWGFPHSQCLLPFVWDVVLWPSRSACSCPEGRKRRKCGVPPLNAIHRSVHTVSASALRPGVHNTALCVIL